VGAARRRRKRPRHHGRVGVVMGRGVRAGGEGALPIGGSVRARGEGALPMGSSVGRGRGGRRGRSFHPLVLIYL
jgi:hypothetical protein